MEESSPSSISSDDYGHNLFAQTPMELTNAPPDIVTLLHNLHLQISGLQNQLASVTQSQSSQIAGCLVLTPGNCKEEKGREE